MRLFNQLESSSGETIYIFEQQEQKNVVDTVQVDTTSKSEGANSPLKGAGITQGDHSVIIIAGESQTQIEFDNSSSTQIDLSNEGTEKIIEILGEFLVSSNAESVSENEKQNLQDMINDYKCGSPYDKAKGLKKLFQSLKDSAWIVTFSDFVNEHAPTIAPMIERFFNQ